MSTYDPFYAVFAWANLIRKIIRGHSQTPIPVQGLAACETLTFPLQGGCRHSLIIRIGGKVAALPVPISMA